MSYFSVEVNTSAFEDNLRAARAFLREHSPDCQQMAVLKADAYGHGLERLVPIAVKVGVEAIGCVDNWEFQVIRDQLNLKSIRLVRLRPAVPGEIQECVEKGWNVVEAIGALDQAQMISNICQEAGVEPLSVYLKIDVGICRAGFSLPSQLSDVEKALRVPGLRLAGVMTHFPVADEPSLPITEQQLGRFHEGVALLREHGLVPADCFLHCANSAAFLRVPASHLGMARVGLYQYGALVLPEGVEMPIPQRPVMRVTTRVSLLRWVPAGSTIGYGMAHTTPSPQYIATLPMGYENAYLRRLGALVPQVDGPWTAEQEGTRPRVLIRGASCPVVGRVSMDMVTVDCTHHPRRAELQAGDEVVLLGAQGDEAITHHELARICHTHTYEICCTFGMMNQRFRRYTSDK